MKGKTGPCTKQEQKDKCFVYKLNNCLYLFNFFLMDYYAQL